MTTVTLDQAIQMALAHQQAGRLAQAEAIYQQILKAQSDHPDALHFLGVIAKQMGKHEIAVELIVRALAVQPDNAAAHYNLGNAQQAQGKLDEAVASYRKALEIKPDYAKVYCNLGNALREQGKYNDAIASFHKALLIEPDNAEAHYNLANTLKAQGKLDDAVAGFLRALAIKPDFAEAHGNLGNVRQAQGQLDEALESLNQALALKPDYAEARNNLANALRDQSRLDEAIASYRKALALKPDFAEAHNNLGIAYQEMGDFSAAESSYRRAIELDGGQDDYKTNLAMLLLTSGDFSAWEGYEQRWEGKAGRKLKYPQPWWDGSDISERSVLVWSEQGIGDELLFASLIPEMSERAGHCVFECERRLVELFSRSFPGVEVIARSTPPHPRTQGSDLTLQSPAGSLMRWLRPDLASFPNHQGYLKADEQRVTQWQERLAERGDGLKIGICWTSGDRSATASKHCIDLAQWGPILEVEGAVFVNLQYTDCREELEQAELRFGIRIQRWDGLDLKNDLDEVAALTSALDLVIAVETAVPRMAGALGRPVWMLTPRNAGWKELGTGRMPWFPDTRLFYREWNESWDGVIDAVAQELKMLIGGESK